jgi:CcmD family protein
VTLRDAIPYVAAAYIAVWVVVLLYVALIGRKLVRIERSIDQLERDAGDPSPGDSDR